MGPDYCRLLTVAKTPTSMEAHGGHTQVGLCNFAVFVILVHVYLYKKTDALFKRQPCCIDIFQK